MLKWYKEFKLLQINNFEKDYNKKINQLENKLLNLVESKYAAQQTKRTGTWINSCN